MTPTRAKDLPLHREGEVEMPEEKVNLDWSEFQDLWHDKLPKDQLAKNNEAAKEMMLKRESPEEEFLEEQLSKKKKYKRTARYKIRTVVIKPPSQAQFDMPGSNTKYRANQPSRLKKTLRDTDGRGPREDRNDFRLSPSIRSGGRLREEGTRIPSSFNEGPRDDPEGRLGDLQAVGESGDNRHEGPED